MEEEKAAAYYDELVLAGGGAARFKQGLGYGSKQPARDSGSSQKAIPASMSNFVRQLSPDKADALHNEMRVESIRSKLTKRDGGKPVTTSRDYESMRLSRRQRSRSPERGRTKSGSKLDKKLANWEDFRSSGRSRSRSRSTGRRKYSRSGSRSTSMEPHRRKRSSISPARARSKHSGHHRRGRSKSADRSAGCSNYPGRDATKVTGTSAKRVVSTARDASAGIDYSTVIPNYDDMTPSQKLKAKMRLQLSQAAENDIAKGMSRDWERFDFDGSAPLDDDNHLAGYGETAGSVDDTMFLKHTGSTFLTSSSQARREATIQEAHEAAMFGTPASVSSSAKTIATVAADIVSTTENKSIGLFVSDEVLQMQQQETWQERAKRMREERAAAAAAIS